MAARNKAWTPTKVRERIRVSMLLRRLTNHVLGKVEMTQSQVTAATYLLTQGLGKPPQQIEHSGQIDHVNYDAAVLGLINGSSTDERDVPSAQQTTH